MSDIPVGFISARGTSASKLPKPVHKISLTAPDDAPSPAVALTISYPKLPKYLAEVKLPPRRKRTRTVRGRPDMSLDDRGGGGYQQGMRGIRAVTDLGEQERAGTVNSSQVAPGDPSAGGNVSGKMRRDKSSVEVMRIRPGTRERRAWIQVLRRLYFSPKREREEFLNNLFLKITLTYLKISFKCPNTLSITHLYYSYLLEIIFYAVLEWRALNIAQVMANKKDGLWCPRDGFLFLRPRWYVVLSCMVRLQSARRNRPVHSRISPIAVGGLK